MSTLFPCYSDYVATLCSTPSTSTAKAYNSRIVAMYCIEWSASGGCYCYQTEEMPVLHVWASLDQKWLLFGSVQLFSITFFICSLSVGYVVVCWAVHAKLYMLFYAVLCCAMLCCAMLRYAMLCCVLPCRVVLRYVMLRYVMVWYDVIRCCVIYVIWC